MEELGPLVERAQTGDLEAYGEIVCRFQDMAYGYAYSILGDFHLAQDAAQEAFVQAYRDLRALRTPAAFPGWFRQIVFKHCDRIQRRRRPAPASLDAAGGEPVSAEPNPAEAVEKQELRDSVLKAVRDLPEHQRTVTTLFYINGYTVNDIADFLETPTGTVKRRLHESRRQLKERMMAMVPEALRSTAPDPDQASDAVAFLLAFAERIGSGEAIVHTLDALRAEAKTDGLRTVIGQMLDALRRGYGLFEVFDKNQGIFPPMVRSLVHDGERFGILDEACRLAATWLRDGCFEVDRYLFAGASFFQLRRQLKRATEQGADAVVIDSTRVAPVTETSERQAVWIELQMPDGTLVKGEPWGSPLDALKEFGRLREHALLDRHQEGDSIAGQLRIPMLPDAATEAALPIAFHPLPDGEEVRIAVNPSRTARTQ